LNNLTLPNPLQVQHLTLLKIRKVIAEQLKKPKVEVTTIGQKQDFFVVSAQIVFDENTKGSVCYGQALHTGTPLVDLLTAEIIALVFACNEQGISFDFTGSPQKIQTADVAPVRNVTKFDRNTILKCRDIDEVKFKMKQHGLVEETGSLVEYGDNLKKQRQRLTVVKAADFLFPKGSPDLYVTSDEPKANVKKEKSEIVAPAEREPERQYQRTGREAQELLTRLTEANITADTLRERGSEFKNMTVFSMYATDEQVAEILGE